MSKISDKLNIIDNAKNDIKTAIENKGINVGDVGLQEYAGKIGEIKSLEDGYFTDTIKSGSSSKPGIIDSIKKIPALTLTGTSAQYLFYALTYLEIVDSLDVSNATNTKGMFGYCNALKSVPKLNLSKSTDTSSMFASCFVLESVSLTSMANSKNTDSMFNSCNALKNIEGLDLSSSTNADGMFRSCESLTNINLVNTPNLTTAINLFYGCKNLETIEGLDTGNLTSVSNMFYNCNKLHTLPLLDFSKVINVSYAFYYTKALANVGGFKDYGKAFSTSSSANYSSYMLTLDYGELTEESIINILENLYDIASMGCNTQKINLGSTNLAKLTSERGQTALANAQTKGWTIA